MSPLRRVAAAESGLAGRGPFAWEGTPLRGGRAGGHRGLGRLRRPRRPGKSGGPGAGRAAEGARRGGAGARTRLRPLPRGKARGRARGRGAGSEAAAGRKLAPRTGAPGPGRRFRTRRPLRGAVAGARRRGGRGRPGADPERRRVCGRRPPRARLLPPRVTRRPSARTSSIRPDRPPAPLPSITLARRGLRGRRRRAPRAGVGRAGPGSRRPPRKSETRGRPAFGATLCEPQTDPHGSEEAFCYQSTNIRLYSTSLS